MLSFSLYTSTIPNARTVRLTNTTAKASLRPSLYFKLRQGCSGPETESRRSQGLVSFRREELAFKRMQSMYFGTIARSINDGRPDP